MSECIFFEILHYTCNQIVWVLRFDAIEPGKALLIQTETKK